MVYVKAKKLEVVAKLFIKILFANQCNWSWTGIEERR